MYNFLQFLNRPLFFRKIPNFPSYFYFVQDNTTHLANKVIFFNILWNTSFPSIFLYTTSVVSTLNSPVMQKNTSWPFTGIMVITIIMLNKKQRLLLFLNYIQRDYGYSYGHVQGLKFRRKDQNIFESKFLNCFIYY